MTTLLIPTWAAIVAAIPLAIGAIIVLLFAVGGAFDLMSARQHSRFVAKSLRSREIHELRIAEIRARIIANGFQLQVQKERFELLPKIDRPGSAEKPKIAALESMRRDLERTHSEEVRRGCQL